MKILSIVLTFLAEVPDDTSEELETKLIDGRLQIGYYKPLEQAGQFEFIPVITADDISGEIATDVYNEHGDREDDDEDEQES